eukprot:GHVO01005760.1.p1 GENE.GHVO01005760.1~~GHVO01005760.1.p1  ORF type:complete len:277 (+),score=33.90 GHVO01005760.1:208-1038(+)
MAQTRLRAVCCLLVLLGLYVACFAVGFIAAPALVGPEPIIGWHEQRDPMGQLELDWDSDVGGAIRITGRTPLTLGMYNRSGYLLGVDGASFLLHYIGHAGGQVPLPLFGYGGMNGIGRGAPNKAKVHWYSSLYEQFKVYDTDIAWEYRPVTAPRRTPGHHRTPGGYEGSNDTLQMRFETDANSNVSISSHFPWRSNRSLTRPVTIHIHIDTLITDMNEALSILQEDCRNNAQLVMRLSVKLNTVYVTQLIFLKWNRPVAWDVWFEVPCIDLTAPLE